MHQLIVVLIFFSNCIFQLNNGILFGSTSDSSSSIINSFISHDNNFYGDSNIYTNKNNSFITILPFNYPLTKCDLIYSNQKNINFSIYLFITIFFIY